MNNWNKLLYTLTGRCLLDPQRLQDLHDKVSRLTHERDAARDACHTQFRENQDYLATLATHWGKMDLQKWPLKEVNRTIHKKAIHAWETSPILQRYHFPIEKDAEGVYIWIHPLALYPAEARLELSRFGVI